LNVSHPFAATVALAVVATTAVVGAVDLLGHRSFDEISESTEVPRYAGPSLDLGSGPKGDARNTEAVATVAGRSITNGCLNSWDRPKCGAAHWDPPVNNQPATLEVDISPQFPREGEMVTFTFTWSDGDADRAPLFSFCSGLSDCPAATYGEFCETVPTGPWSPPPVRRGRGRFVQTAVYPEGGVYAWHAELETDSSSYGELVERYPCLEEQLKDPYASSASMRQPIVVYPPSWPGEPRADDLAFVKTGETGSGKVEVHTLLAAGGYGRQASYASPFPAQDADKGTLQMIDMDGRRQAELVFIQTRNTLSDEVEVNWVTPQLEHPEWVSAASGFSTSAHGDGSFGMTDMDGDDRPELVLVQTRNTASNQIEIHWRRRMPSNVIPWIRYATPGSATTGWGTGDRDNGSYELADMDGDRRPDLVLIKTRATDSGNIEIHWLSAASGYRRQFSYVTRFGVGERGSGTFEMSEMDGDNNPDLVFIKTRDTGSRQVEIHWLRASGGYQLQVSAVTAFSADEHGKGQFSMIDVDGL
jgi:hypothetical protein